MRAFLGLEPHRFELPQALSDDVALLDRLLGTVLEEQGDGELLELARQIHSDADAIEPHALFERIPKLADVQLLRRLLRAYAVLFQLLNTAEQKEIVRVNAE